MIARYSAAAEEGVGKGGAHREGLGPQPPRGPDARRMHACNAHAAAHPRRGGVEPASVVCEDSNCSLVTAGGTPK